MSFIHRELEKLAAAIRQPQDEEVDLQLRAAQQALSWAMEPKGFASPFDMIFRLNESPVTGIPAGSEDCDALDLKRFRHKASSL